MPLTGEPFDNMPPFVLTVLMLVYISVSFLIASLGFGLYLEFTGITGGWFVAIGSVGSIVWPYLRAHGLDGTTTYIWCVCFGTVFSMVFGGVEPRSIIAAHLGFTLGLRCHLIALKFARQELDFLRYICVSLLVHLFFLWVITDDSSDLTFPVCGAIVSLVLYLIEYIKVLMGNVPNGDDIAYAIRDIPSSCLLVMMVIRFL